MAINRAYARLIYLQDTTLFLPAPLLLIAFSSIIFTFISFASFRLTRLLICFAFQWLLLLILEMFLSPPTMT